jgi:hypothetical protein
MNGVRVNEAFGHTINWDLIPTVAIGRADIWTNNPAFGLNAFGGAVSFQLKDGFTFQGFDFDTKAIPSVASAARCNTVSRTSIGRPILRRRGSRTTAGDTSQQQTHNCYCPIRIRTRERWQMRGQTSPFEYVTVSTIGAGSASTIVEKSCDGTPKN